MALNIFDRSLQQSKRTMNNTYISDWLESKNRVKIRRTYCFLPPFLPNTDQRIMIFLYMQIQEVLRREVLSAFSAAICMSLQIVDFIFFVGCK